MALSVGELVAYLRLDKSGYDQGLQQSEQQTSGFRGALGRVQPAAMAVSAGIAAVGAAAWTSAKSTADHAEQIRKTAQESGLGTTAYQELTYAMGQYGVESSDTDRALGRLNQRIGLASQGNENYAESFSDLGVSIEDANGDLRDTDDVMMDVIESLSEIEDPAERSAAASEIFGTRMARKLMPALEDGVDGIDEMREKAHELGIVMDEESISTAEEFADALDDFQHATKGAGQQIGVALLPVLTDHLLPAIQDHLIPALQDFGDWVERVAEWFSGLPDPVQDVTVGFLMLGAVMGPAVALAKALFGPLAGLIGSILSLGKALLFTPLGLIVGLLAALVYGLYTAWQESEAFRDAVSSAWEAIQRAVQPVVDWFQDEVLPALTEIWDAIVEAAGPVLEQLTEWLDGLFQDEREFELPEQIQEMIEFVQELVGGLVESIMEFTDQIREIWDEHGESIMEGVRVVWELISGILEGALTIIMGLFQGVWTAVAGIISGALDMILGIIQVFIGVFTGDWGAAWAGIQQIFSGIWTAISGVLEGAVTILMAVIEGGLQAITSTWDAAWSAVSALVSSIWSGITSLISGAVDSVLGFISGLAAIPGQIGGFFSSAASAAASAIGTLLGHVSGIPGRITSALGNLGSLLRNAGRSVIQGLINGITSMISNIADSMSNVADTIRDYLPFSPAKEGALSGAGNPERAGGTIVDMLADGLGDTRSVDHAMGDLAGRMSVPASAEVRHRAEADGNSPYAPGGRMGGTGPNDGPAVHIDNFQATEHMSPRDVGEALYALVKSRG